MQFPRLEGMPMQPLLVKNNQLRTLGIVLLCIFANGSVMLTAMAQDQMKSPAQERLAEQIIYAREALLVPGEAAVKDVAIHVTNGRIVRVETSVKPAKASDAEQTGTEIIDLSCCFMIPGLIDTQTHLESQVGLPSTTTRLVTWTEADFAIQASVHARRTLQAGFTSIRDMGSHGTTMFSVRKAINQGKIPGPRMQVAGAIIQASGGELRSWFVPEVEALFQNSAICDGADDCRRAVREEVARGSDTIKVSSKYDLADGSYSQLNLKELQAIAEETKRLGVRVTASAFSADSINLPLQAGFDAVVHGVFVNDESIDLLRSTGAYFIPTLVAAKTVKEMAENPNAPFSEAWRKENLDIYYAMVASFLRVEKAGLKIAFGTDAGWRPHGGNAEQLVQMVELGMPAMRVIETATVNAADAMGWSSDVGTLEVGKYADMVVLANNPLQDITEVTRPTMVIKGGDVVSNEN